MHGLVICQITLKTKRNKNTCFLFLFIGNDPSFNLKETVEKRIRRKSRSFSIDEMFESCPGRKTKAEGGHFFT